MIVVLDTTVLIDLLKGIETVGKQVRDLHIAGDRPATTAINVEEIYRGLRTREKNAATELFDWLHILPIGRSEAELAGSWRRKYSSEGLTLSQADCLVAATAFASGAILATGNPKDFPMEDLSVSHWPAGK